MGRVSAFLGMVLYMYPDEELMLNWKLCMEGNDVVWIDPIR